MSQALTTRPSREVDLAGPAVDWLAHQGARVLVVLVLAVLARWVLHRVITRVVESAARRPERRAESVTQRVLVSATGVDLDRHRQRTRTVGSLLRSLVTVTVYGIAGLTVMGICGIPMAPLLTSAGIGGVALGFGAQSLVKDFLSGIVMLLEDQYGVGDVIDTGVAVGTVEEVTLRVTRLRDAQGVTWYVRNGEILRVGNHSQGSATGVVDLVVGPHEPLDRVGQVLRTAYDELMGDPDWDEHLLSPPVLLGVEMVSPGAVTLRVTVECRPGEVHAVKREIRRRSLVALAQAGIAGPDPMLRPGASEATQDGSS